MVAWALGEIGGARAVEPLMACLDDPDESVHQAAASALGKIGDARGISILRERLSNNDSQIRREALFGLAGTCQDEIDRQLLSRNIDQEPPFLDPQEEIGGSQVRQAARKLKLSMEEVKRRYETLAVRFGLKLAWQAEGEGVTMTTNL